MLYFIADTHFFHANIISLCQRPFGSVEEMNETMIRNWNERVGEGDTVYVLGDLFFKCSDVGQLEGVLERLKGKKHLVVGNHDDSWMDKINPRRYFLSVGLFQEVTASFGLLTLCHYPLLTWRHDQKSYMIHGHIHNNRNADYWPLLQRRERVLNAGVEVNGYRPVTFEELLENNRHFKAESVG
ncbi:MAG: metallophosphoesterase [Victivallales bacterium]|nr:metallophosphoesterase [Victivallales bacterium]